MPKIQQSSKLLLLAIPGSVGLGMVIVADRISQSQHQIVEMPTEWKVQTVDAPKFDKKSMHQAFLDRQKQLKDRDFSCDCNGCRITAAQLGVTIN